MPSVETPPTGIGVTVTAACIHRSPRRAKAPAAGASGTMETRAQPLQQATNSPAKTNQSHGKPNPHATMIFLNTASAS
jgi:hypothetical protein